jgi:two-component sensor histidine kinase
MTKRTSSDARSVAWHLGLTCLLLLLPATAFYGWVLWQYAEAERGRLVQEGLVLTRNIADAVSRELASLSGTARLAASAPRLVGPDFVPAETQRTARRVSQLLGVDFVIRSPDGKQLVNSRLAGSEAFPDRPLDVDRSVIERKAVAVSDLFAGAHDEKLLVAVVAPALRPDTGEVLYLVDLTMPAERIRDVIVKQPLGEGLYATVLDRKGRVIARTRGHERFVGTEATAFMQGVTGREGLFRTTSLDGVPILVQYTRVNGSDWIVAVGLEENTLNAPVRRLVLLVALAGLSLGLLSAALAYVFGRRITDAIHGLSTAAAALGRGAPVPVLRTPVAEVNEVGAVLVSAADERRRAEESQTLMVRELHHRVKNTLATVQAVVSSTARTAESIAEFREAVTDRIGSLAKTHTLLVNNAWGGAALQDILWAELSPYETDQHRVRLHGPDLHVPDDIALAFGMAVHELTTNAAKYGSLSVPAGRLDVTWSLEGAGADRRLHLEWRESNGPPVQPARRRGFGSMLLERVLGRQLQGEVDIAFAPEGLCVRVNAPMPQHRSAAGS